MENQTFKALRDVVDRFPRVRMAFLFGSRARQKTRRDSDVDVAVYWEGAPGRREEEALWAALEQAAGTDVDLVRLNDCPPTLAAEALPGIPLVIRDERFYLEYMLE
ncbi:MAG: type VII toxin-antitoxin system MntA family adenylyltransferase antitoxin, partial [Desulfotomaculales bacterium]